MTEETNKQKLSRLLKSVDNLTLRVEALSNVVNMATKAINILITSDQDMNKAMVEVREALAGIRSAEALVQLEATAANRQGTAKASRPPSPTPAPRSRPKEK